MLNKEQLSKFKSANTDRKKVLAARWGVSLQQIAKQYYSFTPKWYNALSTSKKDKNVTLTEVKEDITDNKKITIIYVVDSSSSMFNGYGNSLHKFDVVAKAIEEEIALLQQDKTINYDLKIIEFSNTIKTVDSKLPIAWNRFEHVTRLNDVIIKACDLAMGLKSKVLVKLFTDGAEYGSNSTVNEACYKLRALSSNVTFTFMTPKEDERNISKYGLDGTNCMTFINTASGIEDAMVKTREATNIYATKVITGKCVKSGFYKKMN